MTKVEINNLNANVATESGVKGFNVVGKSESNERSKALMMLISSFGLEAVQATLAIGCIEEELKAELIPHYMLFQLMRCLVAALITENPHSVHFIIVKAAIKDVNPEWQEDVGLRDETARELIKFCKKLKLKMAVPEKIKKELDTQKKYCNNDAAYLAAGFSPGKAMLDVYTLPAESVNGLSFERKDMFLWDWALLETLKLTGKEGKKLAKEGVKSCETRLKNSKDGVSNPTTFWINAKNDYFSMALKFLTKAIVIDIVKKRNEFKKNNVPALTTKIQEPLKQLFSPYNVVEKKNESIQIFNKEKLIVEGILIPVISPKIIPSVFNGAHKLNSKTGHRIIRHFVISAYNQKVSGLHEFRFLKLDRGATELAEKFGSTSQTMITDITEIIHAMAYLEFRGKELTGNLIQLSKYKSPITHRQDAYQIIIGTALLPFQTHIDGGLLIPLLQDPPLVNPNQTHAGQYLMQMEIMAEISNQSDMLAREGVVEITQEFWEKHALDCGLKAHVLKKIQDRWTRDGTDGAQFLVNIEDDYYTLGKEHQKALDFLKQQGALRIDNSKRGSFSASKRRKK